MIKWWLNAQVIASVGKNTAIISDVLEAGLPKEKRNTDKFQ